MNVIRTLADRLNKDTDRDDKMDVVSAVMNSAQRLMEQFAAIKRHLVWPECLSVTCLLSTDGQR